MRDVMIPNWLKELPLAPEFRPTDTEFADPIAYISKIEKEASAFGICKVIPPFPRPSKKYVFANLNKSLSKCPELGSDVNASNACSVQKLDNEDKENNVGEVKAVFTTRQQELGQNEKRAKGVQKNQKQASGIHKQVWQSGEIYTLEDFESKSKIFARSQLGMIKEVSPYVIEALFWKAASEKPIYVEYANDVPGSGFGEPEESPRYFRRSRRRTYSRKSQGSPESKKVQEDHISQLSSQKSGPSNNEISNSPWNLQVIARSPGSLTRFMPDDIPGVTSPMVYIGMLFSWFAWHVEDHELHSLNFLHTGSAKTWYAVPGDYAFTFEELIRTRAYGGNIDRLAALILLGEKTTLLSPEVIVASGIPCCRLLQNPGEFVVTFPRAYHVGFSHGFNCGEAANFGTPKWLTVAKEAAVRRAAMNHLPMLSHQQLLYLLTMSFISRVPRSLLPGVRNSRLRDRQKEEREILVKKAFIEDILKENNLLTYLLQQNSTYRAVLWDLESLPSSSIKESDMGPRLAVTTTQIENVNTETDDKGKLFDQSLCVESLNDYADADDDLSSDFQVDSGALPCVACGLLGFPFMCVLQPSKEASMEIMSANHDMVQDRGIVDPAVCNSGLVLDGMAKVSVSDVKSFSSSADDDLKSSSKIVQLPNGINSTHTTSPSDIPGPDLFVPNDPLISSGTKLAESSNNYLRPRIFCLEHAIEVEVLLHSKGGADVLVICHSDFQKIKAQAAAVAEEIRSPFKYQEIPLNNASLEDLNLVNFAIDDEEQGDECGEDWTTKVKINLRNCVKLRKKFPTEKLQHALTLNGLFFDTDLNASSLSFNWQFKKFRSKRRKINHRDQIENDETVVANSDLQVATSESAPIKKDESLGPKLDVQMGEKQVELIHYFRKRFKSKNSGSLGESKAGGDTKKLLEPVGCAGVTSLGSFDEQMVSGGEDGQFLRDKREFNEASTVSAVLMETCAAEKMDTGSQDGQSLRDKGKLNESSPVSAEAIVDVLRETCDAEKVDSSGENESSLCRKRELNESSRVSVEEIVEIRICAVEETDTSGEHGSYLQDERDFNESCPVSAEEIVEVPTADKIDTSAADGQSLQHKRELNESSRVSTEEIVEVPIETCAAKKMDSGGEDGQSLRDKIELKESSSVSADGTVEVPTETCAALKVDSGSENGQSLRDKSELNESSSVSAKEIIEVPTKTCAAEKMGSSGEDGPSLWDKRELDECGPDSAEKMYSNRENGQSLRDNRELNNCSPDYAERMDSHGKTGQSLPEKREFDGSNPEIQPESVARNARKRKREADVLAEGGSVSNGFIRSPCEGLRPRGRKDTKSKVEENPDIKKSKNSQDGQTSGQNKKENRKSSYKCNIEGCQMRFQMKEELLLHKRNRCPYEGCGKKFSSHKNAVTHARVHNDDRPLKCTWAGCTKSFKWAWARTEHIRVHTGEKPYKCKVDGCGLTFRFVSDFSRHKRKTGHSAD